MMQDVIPTSTFQIIKPIAKELGISEAIVGKIMELFAKKVREALSAELPFAIRNVGKIYFGYRESKPFPGAKYTEFYQGRVKREIRFLPVDQLKAEFNIWIQDPGVRDNHINSIAKLKIAPEELGKIIKKKLLDEQRAGGFRPELLFDDIPESEQSILKDLGPAPTVQMIYDRIRNMIVQDE